MFSSRFREVQLAATLVLVAATGLHAGDDRKRTAPSPEQPAASASRPAAVPVSRPSAPASHGGAVTPATPTPHIGGAPNRDARPQTAPIANRPMNDPRATSRSGLTASDNTPSATRPTVPATANSPSGREHSPSAPSASPNTHQPYAPSYNRTAMPSAPGRNPHSNDLHSAPTPRGAQQIRLPGGNAIQRRPNGHIADVHDIRRGIDIHHNLDGNRRIIVERRDRSRIFVERGRPAFVQRPYVFHGHEYARRTFYYRGHTYQRFYRGYPYRGVYISVYAPVRYYPAGYYGWVYYPWAAPVYYSWGFAASPWYGYYGFYFAPYPVYHNASFWLTDYMISADLASAYEAGREAGSLQAVSTQNTSAPALTPEVKQAIADEVRNQIALENADAQQNARNQETDPGSSGIARMLADGRSHVFVVGTALDVVDQDGYECMVSEGDALQFTPPQPPDATSVSLVVLASKGGRECAKSSTVTVSLADLQEMQNHMRETIDRGLEELRQKQGQNGIPPAPATATAAPVPVAFAEVAPPPDPNDANEIDQQMKLAEQSEEELAAQASQE